jgi:hypothetical protein
VASNDGAGKGTDAGDRWSNTVRAVVAPLGFYVVCLFIVEAAITLGLMQSGFTSDQKFSGLLLGALLFILVVFLTTHLVIYHAESLVFGPTDHLRRRELERQTAAERLQRAQRDTGEDAETAGDEPPAYQLPETFDGGELSPAAEYLELEARAFARFTQLLKPGWQLAPSVKIGRDALVDAVVLGPDQTPVAVIEVKTFRHKRAVSDRIRQAIFQLQQFAEKAWSVYGQRPVQILIWIAASDGARPTPAQLRNLRPVFTTSTTYFALYTTYEDKFAFYFAVPAFVMSAPVQNTSHLRPQ